jgi:hypothetical protein
MLSLTPEQLASLYRHGDARLRGVPVDTSPVVKLYTPDAGAVWLLTELDVDGDRAYGLCDVGLGSPELGHVRLSDLAAMRGPHGLAVAVDAGFVARQPLSAYAEEARRDGSIND